MISRKPIPQKLAKAGITSVRDNLHPGECLNVGKMFLVVFRPEIEAALRKRAERLAKNGDADAHSA